VWAGVSPHVKRNVELDEPIHAIGSGSIATLGVIKQRVSMQKKYAKYEEDKKAKLVTTQTAYTTQEKTLKAAEDRKVALEKEKKKYNQMEFGSWACVRLQSTVYATASFGCTSKDSASTYRTIKAIEHKMSDGNYQPLVKHVKCDAEKSDKSVKCSVQKLCGRNINGLSLPLMRELLGRNTKPKGLSPPLMRELKMICLQA